MFKRSNPSRKFNSIGHQRRGFTLIEILVVMGIIIVTLAMILPLFSVLMGGKGIETSQNRIGALLSRARIQAIGLQGKVGVCFWVDPTTKRTAMALVVQETATPKFIDLDANAEIILLPKGTAAQFLNNSPTTAGVPTSADKYIHQPGLIMFDKKGMLINELYEVHKTGKLGLAMKLANDTAYGYASQFGLVLYDSEAFVDNGFSDEDTPIPWTVAAYTSTTTFGGSQSEQNEEKWLDGSFSKQGQTTPLLVNRYNASLLKAD